MVREHLGAALEEQRDALRILADHEPHEVEAPERPGQAVRGRARPQLGEHVDAVLVGVAHEPVDHGGVVALAGPGEQRPRGLVRDPDDGRRIVAARERLELRTAEQRGLVEVIRHPPILACSSGRSGRAAEACGGG